MKPTIIGLNPTNMIPGDLLIMEGPTGYRTLAFFLRWINKANHKAEMIIGSEHRIGCMFPNIMITGERWWIVR